MSFDDLCKDPVGKKYLRWVYLKGCEGDPGVTQEDYDQSRRQRYAKIARDKALDRTCEVSALLSSAVFFVALFILSSLADAMVLSQVIAKAALLVIAVTVFAWGWWRISCKIKAQESEDECN